MQTKSRIFLLVAKILNIDVNLINEDLSPIDIESWDSLKHMSILMALEEEFNLTLSDEEMVSVGCVGDLLRLVDSPRDRF